MASGGSDIGNRTYKEGDLFIWHGGELIFMSIMMLIGIVGNLLVFYIYHFRMRSNTVTLFKRMLAVLDLATLLLAMPSLMYTIIAPNSSNFDATCVFTSFIALGTAQVSSCVLVIIAVDRYLKLCLLRNIGIGSLLSKKLFIASVLLTCLFNIPCPWIYGKDIALFDNYNVKVSYCFIQSQSKGKVVFFVYVAILGVVFLTVTTTLIIFYYRVVRTLWELSVKHEELKRRPSLAAKPEILQKHKRSEVMRNSAIVFIAVTLVFFASYTPYFITLILSMSVPRLERNMGPALKTLYDLAKLCPLFNNMANPFIYSFTSDHFRQEVKKMLTFKACEKGFFRRRGLSISSRSQELSHISDSKDDSPT